MTIYKGSKLVREFYIKELVARSLFGFVIGIAASAYLYGAGPVTKQAIIGKDKAEVNGKEVEKASLEYSVAQKKKFKQRSDFLPGKIRDE